MAEKSAPVYEMSWLTLTGDDSPLIQCYTSPTWNAFETSAQRMNDCINTMLRLEVFKGSTFARFATSKVSEIQRRWITVIFQSGTCICFKQSLVY